MKKRIFIIVGVVCAVVVVWIAGFLAVMPLWDAFFETWLHTIDEDPHLQAALPYIYDETDIADRYGTIIHVGKKIMGTKESDGIVVVPFNVETKEYELEIYVEMYVEENSSGETTYTPFSYDIRRLDEKSTTTDSLRVGTTTSSAQDTDKHEMYKRNCEVFVDGQELSSEYYAYIDAQNQYVTLPFLHIIQALEGTVTWQTDFEALIQLDEKSYILNILNDTLNDTESGKEYLQALGGNTHSDHFRLTGDEYMIDSDCLQYFFLDVNVIMKLDFNTHIVFISKKVSVPHEENNCTVFVDDQELSTKYYAYINAEQEYAALPFTQIIQALGGCVTWQTDFKALIELDEKEYILDVLNTALTDVESEKDYLQMTLGGTTHYPYFRFTGDEYIMDSDYLSHFFSDMNIRLTMDYDSSSVYINRI